MIDCTESKLWLTITVPLSRPTASQREPAMKSIHMGEAMAEQYRHIHH